MKKILFAVFAATIAMVLNSCIHISCANDKFSLFGFDHHKGIKGSGVVREGTVDVTPDYTTLEVSNAIEVVFVDSGTPRATISADEKTFDHVSVTRNGGTLKIEYEPNTIWVRSKVPTVVKIPVSASLTAIEVAGAVDIGSAVGRLSADTLSVEVTGASKVALDIDAGELSMEIVGASKYTGGVRAGKLSVDVIGASNCKIDGTAENCVVEAVGASTFEGYGLVCRAAEVESIGASTVEIAATESLDAEAVGASTVRYKGGDALKLTSESLGMSSVKKAE